MRTKVFTNGIPNKDPEINEGLKRLWQEAEKGGSWLEHSDKWVIIQTFGANIKFEFYFTTLKLKQNHNFYLIIKIRTFANFFM